jgi:cystathionine beta-lyase
MTQDKLQIETLVTHLGRDPRAHMGAVNTPVFRASTMLFERVADLEAAQRGEYAGIGYGLHGLPTVRDLQSAFAALEGAHASFAVPSGLAAITLALLSVVGAGDHVLVPDSVYGPTRRFCDNHLRRLGVRTTYYDPLVGEGIGELMEARTRVVFVESPGSLTFEVQDVPAIARVAHGKGALVIMDNTWATPLGFRAFEHGVDISVHAGTKYLGGHSDVLIGLVNCSEPTHAAVYRLWTDLGITASSDDAFLALRGLRTLAVRLQRHTESALAVARWLDDQDELARIVFPAYPGAPGHDLWCRDFTGACGLFGVLLKPFDKARVDAMLDGMRLFKMGWSWGGFESLVIPAQPQRMRTATRWPEEGPYLRLHVGLENVGDLIADLRSGLDRLAARD